MPYPRNPPDRRRAVADMARTKAALPPSAPPDARSPFAFESAMTELESVVTRLEQGDLPLDAALKTFERGIELSRLCQSALMDAEQTVEKLTLVPDGLSATEPFAAASSDDDDSE